MPVSLNCLATVIVTRSIATGLKVRVSCTDTVQATSERVPAREL